MDTRCKMQYFHTQSPPMTFKIEPRSPKFDAAMILNMVTIYQEPSISFGNTVDTRCKMHYIHMFGPIVTLKIDPRSSQGDMSMILSIVIIYPNLKAIGEIL